MKFLKVNIFILDTKGSGRGCVCGDIPSLFLSESSFSNTNLIVLLVLKTRYGSPWLLGTQAKGPE